MNGRAKGSVAEREVAALCQAWWEKHEPGCRFVRTPLSGGWGGPDVRAGFRASGDLMTTAKQFPFAVEVKRREGWGWKALLAGKLSPVWDWWRQAIRQADEMNAEPMLWLKHNREPWSLMLRAAYITKHRARPALINECWEWDDLRAERCGGHAPALFIQTAHLVLDLAPGLFAGRVRSTAPRGAVASTRDG